MLPRPRTSTLFPYTTLFRSMKRLILVMLVAAQTAMSQAVLAQMAPAPKPGVAKRADACAPIGRTEDGKLVYSMKCRSEEHTSELQSRRELVCRLLLEKKNHG